MQNILVLLSSDEAVILYECAALITLIALFIMFRIKIKNAQKEYDRQNVQIKYTELETMLKNRKRRKM